jgi:hypothetical protein
MATIFDGPNLRTRIAAAQAALRSTSHLPLLDYARETELALGLAIDAAKRGDMRAVEQELHDAHLAAAMVKPALGALVDRIGSLWLESRIVQDTDAASCCERNVGAAS